MIDSTRKLLDRLLQEGKQLRATEQRQPGTTGTIIPDKQALHRWVAASGQVIIQVAGEQSLLFQEFKRVAHDYPRPEDLSRAIGVLEAFAQAWDEGLLRSRDLLVSAELFEDGLELAEYMLSKGYKDPAAVVAGAVLESALRKMCQLRSIPLGGRETLEPLNDALAKHDPPAYNLAMKKQITAWGSIRNDAAHGRWDQYDVRQVKIMLDGVRGFVATHLS